MSAAIAPQRYDTQAVAGDSGRGNRQQETRR
jgi:hypothetical protein